MSFLPTSVVRLSTLRRGVALKLLALPYVFLLAAVSFGPRNQHMFPAGVTRQIASALNVSSEQVESFGSAMTAITLLGVGYLIGWALNAILLIASGTYRAPQVFQLIAKGTLPASWQNDRADEIIAAAAQRLSEQRAYVAKAGPLRFIALRGGLFCGTVAFVVVHIVLNLVQSQPIVWISLPWKLCFWIAFCTANAAWSWYELRRPLPPDDHSGF